MFAEKFDRLEWSEPDVLGQAAAGA
jgi:hypothetical protein